MQNSRKFACAPSATRTTIYMLIYFHFYYLWIQFWSRQSTQCASAIAQIYQLPRVIPVLSPHIYNGKL